MNINKNTDVVIASLAKLPSKENLCVATAVLLISIGTENEGSNFTATIDMIKSMGIGNLKILVADTLQRHTLYGLNIASSMDAALKRSREAGEVWLKRHASLLANNNFEIIRWDELLNSEAYKYYRSEIGQLYADDIKIKHAIDSTARAFLARYENLEYELNYDKELLFENAKQYLIEECPFIPIWYKQGVDYILYPNSPNDAIQAVREHYINGDGKLNWLRFDFRYRKAREIKLNAIQNARHGFSIDRKTLQNFVKNNSIDNYLFSESLVNKNQNAEYQADNEIQLNCLVDELILTIKNKIIALPKMSRENIYNKLKNEILTE